MDSSISARIASHSFNPDTWLKQIRYVIQVTDSSGESEILRTPKDFKILCKVLLTRWPGCLVPIIPEEYSKVITRQKSPPANLIDSSVVVHNIFLSKVLAVDYFANSDVVKLFLKGPADFGKLTNAYHIPTYSTISENFENSFKGKLDYGMSEDTLQILQGRKDLFKEKLKNVIVFEKDILSKNQLIQDFKAANKKMLGIAEEVYSWMDNEHEVYSYEFEECEVGVSIQTWLLSEIVTLNTVIKAVEKIEELFKIKDLNDKSINTTTAEIQKLTAGKKSISAIINNKSKDDILNAKNKTLEDLNKEKNALEIILPLLSTRMLTDVIPHIEQISEAEFEKYLKIWTGELCKDMTSFRDKLVRNS